MDHLATELIAFIKANPGWSILVIAITAFGESFAFISLLFPGTAVLLAAGGLVAVGAIPFFSTAIAAIIGAVLGDAISFWLGQKFGPLLPRMWPFRKNPVMLNRGIDFFHRYGSASVFIGRFFGPVRAVIPLAAGMMRVPPLQFYIANIGSAVVWAPALLSGALVVRMIFSSSYADAALLAIAAAATVAAAILYLAKRRIREG